MNETRTTARRTIVRCSGSLYLVRNGDVYVRIGRKWSAGAVEPSERAAVLSTLEQEA